MPFHRFVISFILATLTTSLWAQNSNLYVVDIITFLHQPMNAEQEHWPKDIDISVQTPPALLVNNRLQDIFPEINDPTQDYSDNTLPLLPEKYSQLKETSSTIGRLQRYQLIEHVTFAQRIQKKAKAPHIVIQQQFESAGKKYRLGGSVQLSVSRYLHANTHLWLAEMADATKEQPTPETLVIKENNLSEATKITQEALDVSKIENQETWPTLPPLINVGFASEAKHHLQRLAQASEQNEEASANTSVNFISTLKQHRKMRSSERHYIDHPLFGVIIQITPIEKVLEQFQNPQ